MLLLQYAVGLDTCTTSESPKRTGAGMVAAMRAVTTRSL